MRDPDLLAHQPFPGTAGEVGATVRCTEHVALLDVDGRVLATDAGEGGPVVGDDYAALWAGATDPGVAAIADLVRRTLELPGAHLVSEHRERRGHPEHAGVSGDRWWRVAARHGLLATRPRVSVVVEDITDRRGIDDDLRERASLLDHVDAAVVSTDRDGIVQVWNRAAEHLYGWAADEAVGRAASNFIVPAASASAVQSALTTPTVAGGWEGNFTMLRRDGSQFLAHVRDTPVHDPAGAVAGHVGVSVDVTAAAATTAELAAVAHSIGDAVCTLDVDQRVTFANPAAQRLLGGPLDTLVGRPASVWLYERRPDGGAGHRSLDLVTETDPARPAACWIARPGERHVAAEYVATPLRDVSGEFLPGWVLVLRDVTERQAHEAEIATRIEEVTWLRMIRGALDHEGFELHAQPIVAVSSGDVVQHELLLRMRDPDRPDELILPGRFLATAEAFGLAPAIDHWVLEQGFAIAATGVPVEINLSATTLADTGLADRLERLSRETGADPRLVVIELTETALLAADTTARAFVDRIHTLGFEVALDDFGTGYSGFSYLKQLPVDYLKIDIEFVRDAITNPASRHVIAAVVSLARAFEIRTVGEGVEDAATLELLGELGVDFAQGYHLGRPAPLASADVHRHGGSA